MTEPMKHDWPKIIAEIVAAGVSHWKLGQFPQVDADVKTVQSWATGKTEPPHSKGEWLLAFHVELVEKI